jgi:hypothetical protein
VDLRAAAHRWCETWERGWRTADAEAIVALYAPGAVFYSGRSCGGDLLPAAREGRGGRRYLRPVETRDGRDVREGPGRNVAPRRRIASAGGVERGRPGGGEIEA